MRAVVPVSIASNIDSNKNPPSVVCASDVRLYDQHDTLSEKWPLKFAVCIAKDAQWECGAMVIFHTTQLENEHWKHALSDGYLLGDISNARAAPEGDAGTTGFAIALSLICAIEHEGTLVSIGLLEEVRALSLTHTPQKEVHLNFSDDAEASAWVNEIKNIWPNPHLGSNTENSVFGVIAIFSLLQYIPIVGPIFSIFIAIWNCYVMRKSLRQQNVSGQKNCCTPLCNFLCCLPSIQHDTSAVITSNPVSNV